MKGAGRKVVAFIPSGCRIEPELMYNLLDGVTSDPMEVISMLKEAEKRIKMKDEMKAFTAEEQAVRFDGMTFGMALEAMKQGKKVARKGWNGKGMYLWILPAASVKAEWCKEPHLKTLAEQNGGEVECLGSVRMKTADGKVLTGWLASQTDMLSDDWQIVD